ncbi:MAG: sigma-54 dependent transcriptional regulator [Polyangiaceae bacterium]|jgi:DNA-binding NtrC family response regulator
MNSVRAPVYVVDDDSSVRESVGRLVRSAGWPVEAFASAQEFLKSPWASHPSCLVLDLDLPGLSGLELQRQLDARFSIIFLTGHGDVSTSVQAMKAGALEFLTKPPLEDQLVEAIRQAFARTPIVGPAPSGKPPSAELTFGAPSMIPVVHALARVARTAATVLLQGESGTGKEVAARLIHETSSRAKKPFIAVNCAFLTEELLESELLGHERGAFTGAYAKRRGRIELADGGTFFLDEVGELKPKLQAKLLRVLEERCFERLGGSTAIAVDVRWVAATNRDLRSMVQEGTFREDLYHRLAVFPIHIPPLRERRKDIVPLAKLFVAQLSASVGKSPALRLDDATKDRLQGGTWPGNVRELRNTLERAVILADGPVIRPEHLWIEESSASIDAVARRSEGSIAELERQLIERTLAAVGGNRRLAAAKLGIGLRTLYSKLKRHEDAGPGHHDE